MTNDFYVCCLSKAFNNEYLLILSCSHLDALAHAFSCQQAVIVLVNGMSMTVYM